MRSRRVSAIINRAAEPLAAVKQLGHALRRCVLLTRDVPMAGLEISTDKIGFVIVKAREWRPRSRPGTTAPPPITTPSSILEDFSDDATQAELKEFIRDLNEDEQASLVALAWIGRGSFAPEELEEALDHGRARAHQPHRGLSARHAAAPRLSRGRARPARLFGRGHRGRRALSRELASADVAGVSRGVRHRIDARSQSCRTSRRA